MDKDDQLLIAQTEDRTGQCVSRSMVTAGTFLDMHQQSVLRNYYAGKRTECRLAYYGGYSDAERVVCFCLPDYVAEGYEDEYYADVLKVIRVSHSRRAVAGASGRELKHGDYLGSVLGLGITRESVGDILVRDDGADIVVLAGVSEFILNELKTVGRSAVEVAEEAIGNIIIPEREYEEFTDSVASLRLDNVVSAAFKIQRSQAQEAIKEGIVFVNSVEALKPDRDVSEGDTLVLRHKGKVVLSEVGGVSRKGRTFVKFRK